MSTDTTSLELIRTKIADLEAKLVNLRIAEKELQDLEMTAACDTRRAILETKPDAASANSSKTERSVKAEAGAEDPTAPTQTIGAAITWVLQQHGPLSAKAIASAIQESGKDINNRAVSFALQALKKRGLAKTVAGEWSLRARRKRMA